jgi:hypothetical protein
VSASSACRTASAFSTSCCIGPLLAADDGEGGIAAVGTSKRSVGGSGARAQKRKMREDDGMYQGSLTSSRAPQRTRDLRNEDRQTGKSRDVVAAKGFAIRSKEKHGRQPYAALVAKTHGKNDRPVITDGTALDHPRSLLDDAPAVGQSTCTKWTGLDSRAEQRSIGAARRYRMYRNDCWI